MKLQTKPKVEITKDLLYNGDFSDVVTIKENKHRTFVNAICATMNLRQAALETGVSDKTMVDFCSKYNICNKKRTLMRRHFFASGIRVKLRFDYG